jgi:hypothetical protein
MNGTHTILIKEYFDEYNIKDMGNNCFYIAVVKDYNSLLNPSSYVSSQITENFNIDFESLAKEYNGFVDEDGSVFFHSRADAELCGELLLTKIKC